MLFQVSGSSKRVEKRFCLAQSLAWYRLGLHDAAYQGLVAALRLFDVGKRGTVSKKQKKKAAVNWIDSFDKVLFSHVVLVCAELAAADSDPQKRDSFARDVIEASKQMAEQDSGVFLVQRALEVLRHQHLIPMDEKI